MEWRNPETIAELNRKIEEFETYALINSGVRCELHICNIAELMKLRF